MPWRISDMRCGRTGGLRQQPFSAASRNPLKSFIQRKHVIKRLFAGVADMTACRSDRVVWRAAYRLAGRLWSGFLLPGRPRNAADTLRDIRTIRRNNEDRIHARTHARSTPGNTRSGI